MAVLTVNAVKTNSEARGLASGSGSSGSSPLVVQVEPVQPVQSVMVQVERLRR